MLKEGTYISIVDGLSEVASEEALASQGGTEYGVCRLGIAERKADIADAMACSSSVPIIPAFFLCFNRASQLSI